MYLPNELESFKNYILNTNCPTWRCNTAEKSPHSQTTVFQISEAEIKDTWKRKSAHYDGTAASPHVFSNVTQA